MLSGQENVKGCICWNFVTLDYNLKFNWSKQRSGSHLVTGVPSPRDSRHHRSDLNSDSVSLLCNYAAMVSCY